MKANNQKDWYRLDNAAKIFPAVANKKETNTFRVQTRIKEEVDPKLLSQAANIILTRFPVYKVRLKAGIFWNYFEYNERQFNVEPLTYKVNAKTNPKENNGYLLKVFYYNNLIVVEFFHSLTDGTGALSFLKALVYEYLILKGASITPDNLIITKDSLPSIEEAEDGQSLYYDSNNCKHIKEKKAYRIKGTFLEDNNMGLISGTLSSQRMLELARSNNCTITEYLSALSMFILYELYIKHKTHLYESKKPVKVFVPVNMRKHFPSKTLRNFAIFLKTDMVMARNDITFAEILTLVKSQFKEGLEKKELIRKMSENVKFEKNIFLRFAPYFIKRFALKLGYALLGNSLITLTISNMGIVEIPKSMQTYINDFQAAIYSGKNNPLNIAVLTYNDKLKITFTRSIIETNFEKEFFRHFTSKGFEVEIESNYVEE